MYSIIDTLLVLQFTMKDIVGDSMSNFLDSFIKPPERTIMSLAYIGMSDRKVHFSSPIHRIEYLDKQWETASRLARDGSDWLRMSLDRQRFRDRIERTGEKLNRILDFDFRQQIYRERFENTPALEQQATIATTAAGPLVTTITTEVEKQSIESTNAPQQQEESQQQPSLVQQHHHHQQQRTLNNRGRRRRKRNNKRRMNRGGRNERKK